jgi:hypothetical protein
MDRRDMLLSLSATLALPFIRTADDVFALGTSLHRSAGAGAPYRTLDLREQQLIAALANRILPATSTPGALDVGVPAFIDRLLTDWYEPEDARVLRSDVAAIDARAQAASGAAFAALPEASQVSLMQTLDAASDEDTPAHRGFRQVKALTVFGYFTSERVAKDVLRTQIIFPSYDGCAPVSG